MRSQPTQCTWSDGKARAPRTHSAEEPSAAWRSDEGSVTREGNGGSCPHGEGAVDASTIAGDMQKKVEDEAKKEED